MGQRVGYKDDKDQKKEQWLKKQINIKQKNKWNVSVCESFAAILASLR